MSDWRVALACLVGGLLTLERKALAQFMLARPIVVAPVVAWVLGDARAGFQLGIPLELFFLGTSSYGASTPNHETLAALFAVALATCAGIGVHPLPAYSLALSFFLALPFAPLGKLIESSLERWNGSLVDRAEEALLENRPGLASRQLLIGLLGTFVMGASVTALGALLGPAVGALEGHLPGFLYRGLGMAWVLAIGLSSGLAIRAIKLARGVVLSGVAATMVFVVYGVVTYVWGDFH